MRTTVPLLRVWSYVKVAGVQEITFTVDGEPTPEPTEVETPRMVVVTMTDELVRVMVSLSLSTDHVPLAGPVYCDVPLVPPLEKLTVKADVPLYLPPAENTLVWLPVPVKLTPPPTASSPLTTCSAPMIQLLVIQAFKFGKSGASELGVEVVGAVAVGVSAGAVLSPPPQATSAIVVAAAISD